jgi:hypothetical protein
LATPDKANPLEALRLCSRCKALIKQLKSALTLI